jgi:cyanophycinase-like exopeptidase
VSASVRLLTIMGSGETAPTMVKTHRMLLERLGPAPKALVLDTPYGFQENAPELATRAQEYFRQSVGTPIDVAGLLRVRDADELTVAQGVRRLRDATYLFAGPGSPTYTLRQWIGTTVPAEIAVKLRDGGAVTFASAAALTLGRATVPVYEIYKAGEEPHWFDGLDLLAAIGLDVAVIPHYDNTEGGHHDTRFCYLGERRLRMMEDMLPDGVHVLGVDEHTGVVIDIDAGTASIVGNATVTVRVRGASTVYETGTTLPLAALHDPSSGAIAVAAGRAETVDGQTGREPEAAPATSLAAETVRCEAAFDAAFAARDAPGATRAVLELEAAITAWSADTLQSDEGNRARAALRSMIVRLGEAATGGLNDPREAASPFVETLLALRTVVRAEKRYDLSDQIRDGLAAAGVEVRDTPAGVEWLLDSDVANAANAANVANVADRSP